MVDLAPLCRHCPGREGNWCFQSVSPLKCLRHVLEYHFSWLELLVDCPLSLVPLVRDPDKLGFWRDLVLCRICPVKYPLASRPVFRNDWQMPWGGFLPLSGQQLCCSEQGWGGPVCVAMEVLEMQTENRRNGRLTDQAWLNTDGFVWLNFEVKRLAMLYVLTVCLACVQLLQERELTPMGKLFPLKQEL